MYRRRRRRLQGCPEWGFGLEKLAVGLRTSRIFSVTGEGCALHFLWLVLSWQWGQKLEKVRAIAESIAAGVFVGLPELLVRASGLTSWASDF